jgi:hypothetical protein
MKQDLVILPIGVNPVNKPKSIAQVAKEVLSQFKLDSKSKKVSSKPEKPTLVYINANNQIIIPSKTFSNWIVKSPTRTNAKYGNISFDAAAYYQFKNTNKQGLLIINKAKKQVITIPLNLAQLPEYVSTRTFAGTSVITLLNVDAIIKDYKLEWTKIPHEN